MTNSLNTPAEALEYAYPLRVRRYSLRPGSGGRGKYHGGDGIVREIEVLTDCEVTLLADRRVLAPWGLNGGGDGAPGRTSIIRNMARSSRCPENSARASRKGDRITIETPGGGGWGAPESHRFRTMRDYLCTSSNQSECLSVAKIMGLIYGCMGLIFAPFFLLFGLVARWQGRQTAALPGIFGIVVLRSLS